MCMPSYVASIFGAFVAYAAVSVSIWRYVEFRDGLSIAFIVLSGICTMPYNFIGTNSKDPRIILFWTHLIEWVFIAGYTMYLIIDYEKDNCD